MRGRYVIVCILWMMAGLVRAQDGTGYSQESNENRLKLSGELMTDERFLLNEGNDWAWNENRLSLKMEKKIAGTSSFAAEIWLRNIGLPELTGSSDLYNKGIVDPYNLEIREANVRFSGFLSKNLDLTIGRQRIVWGTADVLGPTDNLNPYDMEDILDFGRHRGSDAINLQLYLTNDLSLQAVYLPFFQPANLPVGLFSEALNASSELPTGLVLMESTDTILYPGQGLAENATAGLRIKTFLLGLDFSVSYLWGYDGLPAVTKNTFTPVDAYGGVSIESELSFQRTHIIGADMAGSIAGIGVWAELAAVLPDQDLVMSNDLSALYPASPDPVIVDSVLVDKAYLKCMLGGDYNFPDGSYLNLQCLHGFVHERGQESLNDYIFMRYEKKFFNEKLNLAPIGGALIITDWKDLKNHYAFAYTPLLSYSFSADVEISLSAAIFGGKGDNLFTHMKEFNMCIFNMTYYF